MSAREDIRERLEDAGHEVDEVKFFFTATQGRGWYYRPDVDADWIKLGDNAVEALAVIKAMPNPNKVEKPAFEGTVTPETHPELLRTTPENNPDRFDEFGNPVRSPFGHR